MNDSPLLDDFEQLVAHTLDTKANQLTVDDESFDPDGPVPVHVTLVRTAPSTARPNPAWGRRILAVAAAVAALAGAAVVLGTGTGDEQQSNLASQDLTWNSAPDEGTAAFVPTVVPEGWSLVDVNIDRRRFDMGTTWQLFAVDGPSPLARGVVVGSAPRTSRVLPDGANHTVQGQPAFMGPSGQPNVPEDAIEIDWIDGEVVYDAVAVGLTEDELLDFLDSLVPRADPETGFVAPADSPLAELAATADPEELVSSSLVYAGPGGVGEMSVSAANWDFGGGLLHRLVGEDRAGGPILRGGEADWQFASISRPGGWTFEVSTRSSPQVPVPLESVLDSLEPVTGQQLLDLALTEPVARTKLADGWLIEVHGQEGAEVALCLAPPTRSAPVCTLASTLPTPLGGLTTGSALVDGEWVVFVMTDGTSPAELQTVPGHDAFWPANDTAVQPTLEVVTIPADIDGVMVAVTDEEGGGSGFNFERPAA